MMIERIRESMTCKKDIVLEKRIDKFLFEAEKIAKNFNRVFDYTPGSIKDLDQIVDYYSRDIRARSFPEDQISEDACIFGVYLGQVLLDQRYKKEGYRWALKEDSSFPILKKGWSYISPVERVYKRLVLGHEEDILAYYEDLMTL